MLLFYFQNYFSMLQSWKSKFYMYEYRPFGLIKHLIIVCIFKPYLLFYKTSSFFQFTCSFFSFLHLYWKFDSAVKLWVLGCPTWFTWGLSVGWVIPKLLTFSFFGSIPKGGSHEERDWLAGCLQAGCSHDKVSSLTKTRPFLSLKWERRNVPSGSSHTFPLRFVLQL